MTPAHGELREVAPGRIEQALRAIWSEEASRDKGFVGRACLLTLIGVAREVGQATGLEEVLDTASERIPSRVLMLVADANAPDGLRASVNTNFHTLARGQAQLYSEEVHLKAGGRSIEGLASLVRTLRASDVPAVLYWPGRLPVVGDPLRDLIGAVDRLVVDTWDFDDVMAIDELHGLAVGRMLVSDLNWQRLQIWRRLVAHVFEGPYGPTRLAHLDRVTLTHGAGTSGGTILFAGWLASRLGWHDAERWDTGGAGAAWRLLRADGEPVVLQFEEGGAGEGLSRVQLEVTRGPHPASLSVRRKADGFELRGTGMPASLARVAREPKANELLVQVLRSPEQDENLTAALRAASALLQAPGLET